MKTTFTTIATRIEDGTKEACILRTDSERIAADDFNTLNALQAFNSVTTRIDTPNLRGYVLHTFKNIVELTEYANERGWL